MRSWSKATSSICHIKIFPTTLVFHDLWHKNILFWNVVLKKHAAFWITRTFLSHRLHKLGNTLLLKHVDPIQNCPVSSEEKHIHILLYHTLPVERWPLDNIFTQPRVLECASKAQAESQTDIKSSSNAPWSRNNYIFNINTYARTCLYIFINIYMYTDADVYRYIHTHTYTFYVCVCMYIDRDIHTTTDIDVYIDVYYTFTRIHTDTPYKHTYTYIFKYTCRYLNSNPQT